MTPEQIAAEIRERLTQATGGHVIVPESQMRKWLEALETKR